MSLSDEFLDFTAQANAAEEDSVNQSKPAYRFMEACGRYSKAIFYILCAISLATSTIIAIWLR